MIVRTWGLVLLVAGVIGFLHFSGRMAGLAPVPAEVSLGNYLQYEAGKVELARYAAALVALVGALLCLFPKGR